MAYDASNTDDGQTTVSSSTPLGQGNAATPAQQPTGDSAAPTPAPQTGASSVESSQPQTTNKKAAGASSGMFTNIQKYVQKNRPQAQKMSKAVQQDVGDQAAEIRSAAEKKQADTNATLAANKGTMDTAMKGAETAVGNIMGTNSVQPTDQPAPAPMAAETFTNLTQGKIAGVSDVAGPNLAQENMKAQALQNLAGSARTEQGRKNLLRGTFGDQGKYTRGMGGLDQLILGGDQAAREGLISGVDTQAGQISQDIGQIQGDARQDILAQENRRKEFGGKVAGLATGAESQIDTAMDKSFTDEISKRAELTGDYDKAMADMQAWKEAKLGQLGDVEDYKNVANQILGSGSDLGWRGQDYFEKAAAGAASTGPTGLSTRIGEDNFKGAMKNIMDSYRYGGDENLAGTTEFNPTWDNIWNQSSSSNKSSSDQLFNEGSIQDAFRGLKSSIEGIDPAEFLKEKFAAENAGQSYDDYVSGKGLDSYDTASDQDIEKLKQLQELTGKTGGYTDELRDNSYTKSDVMQNLLKKYSV